MVTKHLQAQKLRQLGQGMTEYIIIVALIAVAAIGTFKMFGQTIRNQVAGLAQEVSGQNGGDAKDAAQSAADQAASEANVDRNLGSYNGGNEVQAAGGGG
ncbi:MAG: pilus assembly protein [Spongiibacteraceae bacterium]